MEIDSSSVRAGSLVAPLAVALARVDSSLRKAGVTSTRSSITGAWKSWASVMPSMESDGARPTSAMRNNCKISPRSRASATCRAALRAPSLAPASSAAASRAIVSGVPPPRSFWMCCSIFPGASANGTP